MRLRAISDIDTANTFLPAFIKHYNQRFAVAPQNPSNAHRPVLHSEREQKWTPLFGQLNPIYKWIHGQLF